MHCKMCAILLQETERLATKAKDSCCQSPAGDSAEDAHTRRAGDALHMSNNSGMTLQIVASKACESDSLTPEDDIA